MRIPLLSLDSILVADSKVNNLNFIWKIQQFYSAGERVLLLLFSRMLLAGLVREGPVLSIDFPVGFLCVEYPPFGFNAAGDGLSSKTTHNPCNK
jgi:hypothetical protein